MIANTLHRVLLDSMKDMLRIICPPQVAMKVCGPCCVRLGTYYHVTILRLLAS